MENKDNIISAYRLGINSLINPKKYNGFIGISASYPFFSNEPLENYCESYYHHKHITEFIKFGSAYFDNFLVFLMDLPLSYNLMAFNDIKQDDAKKIASRVGDILENKINNTILQENNRSPDIILLRWRDIENNPEFNETLDNIKNYSKENKRFECECTDLTISGTWNKLRIIKNRFGTKKYHEALSTAKQYSFLDVALDLHLFENFPINISKYECPLVIKSLYNGLFPDLQKKLNLPKIGHVQLSFEDKSYLKPFDDQFEEVYKNGK